MNTNLFLSVLFVAFCCGLGAQTQVNVSDTVKVDRLHVYLLRVDHGSTPTPVDITFSVSTTSPAGVSVGIADLDEWTTATMPFSASAFVVGAGTASDTLALPSRTGIHELILRVEPAASGADADYVGDVMVSAGTVSQGGFENAIQEFDGVRLFFGRIFEFDVDLSGTGNENVDFEWDFGSGVQSATVHLLAQAGGVNEVRLLNTTVSPAVELISVTATGGQVVIDQSVTTPALSGKQKFRLEFNKDGSPGYAQGRIVLPSNISFVLPKIPDPPKEPDEEDEAEEFLSCSGGASGATGIALLFAILCAAWGCYRQRYSQ